MLAALTLMLLVTGDWPRLFGPDGDSTTDVAFPVEWSTTDYAWSRSLPGEGHSQPIVVGDRLYLTTGLDLRVRALLCLDATTGESLWKAETETRGVRLHRKNSGGSSTPAYGLTADGEGRLVAVYADAFRQLAVAFDMDGRPVWERDLGHFESQHGHGASPLIENGRVYLANDQLGDSSVVALDLADGEIVWSTSRKVSKTAYATPRMATVGDRRVLIVLSDAEGVAGLDPDTGEALFASGPQPARVVASPVLLPTKEGLAVLISSGSGGGGKHMERVDVRNDGRTWNTSVRWTRSRTLPYVPTPVIAGDLLFLWNDNGTLICVDPDDGSNIWAERLGGNFSGSPLLAGGRLYAISEDGEVVVVDASRTFRRHPGGRIPDGSHSTPSAGDRRMYLRGFASLSALPAE